MSLRELIGSKAIKVMESGEFEQYDHWPLRPCRRLKFEVSFWKSHVAQRAAAFRKNQAAFHLPRSPVG